MYIAIKNTLEVIVGKFNQLWNHNMLKFQKFSYCYGNSFVISNAKNVISNMLPDNKFHGADDNTSWEKPLVPVPF